MTVSLGEHTTPEDEEGNNTRSKVNLDAVLVEEIGQFGWFQLRVLLFSILAVIFTAWSSAEYVFTTGRISTRCVIPECDGEQPEFSPAWASNAIPASGAGLDNCQRFGFVFNTTHLARNDSCPAELFDTHTLVPCDAYVYENTNTVVYDFELACEEWRRTLIGSYRTAGTLLALPITGYISDRWGRRVALTVSAVNTAWLGALRYFTTTYSGFIASQVIESILGSGIFSSAYILMMEVTGPKRRVLVGATLTSFFAVGQSTAGLIAWRVQNWRMYTLALYIPMFVSISYVWIMTESVRWYVSKGRYGESEAVLHKMAKINRKKLSQKSLEALKNTAEEEKKIEQLKRNEKTNEPWLIVEVIKHKSMLLRCVICPVWWVTMYFIYFGLSINSVNISGNRYLNYAIVAAVDIPGNCTAVLLMNRIGRKPVLTGAYWCCAACQVAYIFLPAGYNGWSLAFYLIGKCCMAIVVVTLYTYTTELYPTKHRHSLYAYSAMVGKVGTILAPLTPAFGAATFESFPFVLFASLALLSGMLMFLTPETLGTTLPDTMEEAEQLRTKKYTKSSLK